MGLVAMIIGELLAWLDGPPSRPLPPTHVPGDAMAPILERGQRVRVRTLTRDEPLVGQIVVGRGPDGTVVQRVTADTIDGFILAGDNRSAREDAGPVPRDDIIGVLDLRGSRAGWRELGRKIRAR